MPTSLLRHIQVFSSTLWCLFRHVYIATQILAVFRLYVMNLRKMLPKIQIKFYGEEKERILSKSIISPLI